ncbi:Anp1-domain-containing protein, partial [Jimgerdemannia flammicorona]
MARPDQITLWCKYITSGEKPTPVSLSHTATLVLTPYLTTMLGGLPKLLCVFTLVSAICYYALYLISIDSDLETVVSPCAGVCPPVWECASELVLGKDGMENWSPCTRVENPTLPILVDPALFEGEFTSSTPFNTTNTSPLPSSSPETATVLILTPLKSATAQLPTYISLLRNLTYPPHLISLGFLVTPSSPTDTTLSILLTLLETELSLHPYHRMTVHTHTPTRVSTTGTGRHVYGLQPLRRQALARMRNRLLLTTLRDQSHVLWLDSDLISYPPTLLTDLLHHGRAVNRGDSLLNIEVKTYHVKFRAGPIVTLVLDHDVPERDAVQ